MKHRIRGYKLNRDLNHRKALFKNLISTLILTGQVTTTEAKAKAVKRLIDKLVTKAKRNTLPARRLIAAFLNNPAAVSKLVDDLAPQFKHRSSGFTAIERVSRRRGDNALTVELKLVGQEVKPKKSLPKSSPQSKKKIAPPRPIPADQVQPKATPVKAQSTAQTQKRGQAK